MLISNLYIFAFKYERQLVHIFTTPDFIMVNYSVTDIIIYCNLL